MTQGASDNGDRSRKRGDGGRQERLAAELRANLKRRKARERALADADKPSPARDGGDPARASDAIAKSDR